MVVGHGYGCIVVTEPSGVIFWDSNYDESTFAPNLCVAVGVVCVFSRKTVHLIHLKNMCGYVFLYRRLVMTVVRGRIPSPYFRNMCNSEP